MNSFIILFFLLYCNGGCNGCEHNHWHDSDDRRTGDSCNICDKPCHNCERDDRDRDDMTPPPWIKSNYANGDSCGCEK